MAEYTNFYKFPEDSILKQNWMISVQSTSISVTSTTSNECFTNYTECNSNNTKRNLVSKVVIKISKTPNLTLNILNTITEQANKNENNSKKENSEMKAVSKVNIINTEKSNQEVSEVFCLPSRNAKPNEMDDSNSLPQKNNNNSKINRSERYSPYSIQDLIKKFTIKYDMQPECVLPVTHTQAKYIQEKKKNNNLSTIIDKLKTRASGSAIH